MKLILAIINHDDAHSVIQHLTQAQYHVTKLATTGGFLRAGNTTLICGVQDDRLEDLVSIIEKKCKGRRQITSINSSHMSATESYVPYPVEVTVGGATIFVLNVEEFRKV
jgi:uncharacterized protein YaaQ